MTTSLLCLSCLLEELRGLAEKLVNSGLLHQLPRTYTPPVSYLELAKRWEREHRRKEV
jgi:hypothetical protein